MFVQVRYVLAGYCFTAILYDTLCSSLYFVITVLIGLRLLLIMADNCKVCCDWLYCVTRCFLIGRFCHVMFMEAILKLKLKRAKFKCLKCKMLCYHTKLRY